MKKRLSLILALSVLIPSFVQAGGKMFHQRQQAIQEINDFLHDDYSDVEDKNTFIQYFNEDKQNLHKELASLTPNQRGFYSRKIHQRRQQIINQRWPRNRAVERDEREERNRRNRERNRAQLNTRRTRTTKNKKKSQSLKKQVASWVIKQFTQHPLRTLTFLGGLTAGGYKLWQLFNGWRNTNANQPQNQNNQQVQCLLCEQQFAQNKTVALECDHTFCGNCLHEWVESNRTINRKCPVRACTRHLCSNQCRRSANNNAPCDDLIQPLQRRIHIARQQQNSGLNNNQNNFQNNQQQPQQQGGGMLDMLLRMGTMGAMNWFGL